MFCRGNIQNVGHMFKYTITHRVTHPSLKDKCRGHISKTRINGLYNLSILKSLIHWMAKINLIVELASDVC